MNDTTCGDIRYLGELEEIEADCRRSLEILLHADERNFPAGYLAGVPALLQSCRRVIDRVRDERARFGLWCAEGREPEEVLQELAQEIERMITEFEQARNGL